MKFSVPVYVLTFDDKLYTFAMQNLSVAPRVALRVAPLGTFRLDYEYEIEYECEFRISNKWRF